MVIVSDSEGLQLHLHSLEDGSLVGAIGDSGQFAFEWGGLCVAADDDSVLVADSGNDCVQELLIADGELVRCIGVGLLSKPQFVDCNDERIVVSQSHLHRISVLSWDTDMLLAQFGSEGSGPEQLCEPCGIRLLADYSGLVVADSMNNRLCVFRLNGELVSTVGSREQGLTCPYDVLECNSDGSFIVANRGHTLVRVSGSGSTASALLRVAVYGQYGEADGEFDGPSSLAALLDNMLVVREWEGGRLQLFRCQL